MPRIGHVFSVFAAAAFVAHADPLAELNRLRATNGLPAGITENPAWSAGCAAHMRYLELNDFKGDWHTEVPGRPGYSEAGRDAARGSVLSNGPSLGVDPAWERAPFHYAQLLAPALSVSGAADGCIYTSPGYRRPAPAAPVLYPFPGEGVRAATSPFLFLLAFGTSEGRLGNASLVGPDGPVPLRVIDNSTLGAQGYLPPGGILVPGAPLQDDAAYTAQATFTADDGWKATKRWTFTTGTVAPAGELPAVGGAVETVPPRPLPHARTPRMTLTLRALGAGARATLSASGNALGRRANVTVRRRDCICRPWRRAYALTRTPRRIDAGGRPVRVTVTLPGFYAGDVPYRGLTLERELG